MKSKDANDENTINATSPTDLRVFGCNSLKIFWRVVDGTGDIDNANTKSTGDSKPIKGNGVLFRQ